MEVAGVGTYTADVGVGVCHVIAPDCVGGEVAVEAVQVVGRVEPAEGGECLCRGAGR